MESRFLRLGIGGVVGVALLLLGWQIVFGSYDYQGSLIEPPVPASDFELIDQSQQTFRLSDQRGKVVLIFFGYTNCPDVCPVTLTDYKRINEQLGQLADQVKFVFITVDPERDTTERLKVHLVNYDPAIIGLTGNPDDLAMVMQKYGVFAARRDEGSAAGYLMDHTARLYVLDRSGNLRLTYPFGMERQAIIDDLRHLLRED